MGLVIDTTLFIAAERGTFRLDEFLIQEASTTSIFIAAITASELLHGVYRASGERRNRRSQHVEEILETVDAIPFDMFCARKHAQLWVELELKGCRIGAHDMLIAATCLSMNHSLATLNENEFSRVEDLKLANARPYLNG